MAMIGKAFKTLEHRIIYYYVATMPAFIPIKSADVSIQSQYQFYQFMQDCMDILYCDPTVLGLNETPDAFYPDFALNKSNPHLIELMRKITKKIEYFYNRIIFIGLEGVTDGAKITLSRKDHRIYKKTLQLLQHFDLNSEITPDEIIFTSERHPNMFAALCYLASKASDQDKRKGMITFVRCVFNEDYKPYGVSIFDKIMTENPAYNRLKSYLQQEGYVDHITLDDPNRIDYIKNNGKKDLKVCSPEAAKHYWGVSFEYDKRRKNQMLLSCRFPQYKHILASYTTLSPEIREIIIQHTKPCNACGYCTQTDKTGKRKPLTVHVEDDKSYYLCPLYPVWGYKFTHFNYDLVDKITKLLSAFDEVYQEIL